MFQRKKSAVRADHQRLARFTEFFAIVSASLRLHLHLAENASAAPGSGKLGRRRHAFIIEKAVEGVNWPAGQVYRIVKRQRCSLVPSGKAVIQSNLAGGRRSTLQTGACRNISKPLFVAIFGKD